MTLIRCPSWSPHDKATYHSQEPYGCLRAAAGVREVGEYRFIGFHMSMERVSQFSVLGAGERKLGPWGRWGWCPLSVGNPEVCREVVVQSSWRPGPAELGSCEL